MNRNEVLALMNQRSERDQAALAAFTAAITESDCTGFRGALAECQNCGLARQAFRVAARLPAPSRDLRNLFLGLWQYSGDDIRDDVNDGATLMDALWRLLPAYDGPIVTLYRGDSVWNRRRRAYGVSWSLDIETARGFACGMWRTFEGGSVIMETTAGPEAIISQIPDNDYGEREFLVDRRRLARIRVLERIPHTDMDEYTAATACEG